MNNEIKNCLENGAKWLDRIKPEWHTLDCFKTLDYFTVTKWLKITGEDDDLQFEKMQEEWERIIELRKNS